MTKLRCGLVATFLKQDVEFGALLIDRTPQQVGFAKICGDADANPRSPRGTPISGGDVSATVSRRRVTDRRLSVGDTRRSQYPFVRLPPYPIAARSRNGERAILFAAER
ncbi:hypothetical protein PQR46_12445 [Paraburkholderia sediminicola]